MAFSGTLKDRYADQKLVLDYLVAHADVWQDENQLQRDDEVFATWDDFIYSWDLDGAYFGQVNNPDDELVVRKPFDIYQLARQVVKKVGSDDPKRVLPIVDQTINQNVLQMLRVRMQWQNGPFSQQMSRVALQERGEIGQQSNL
jgi:hypothetical protein